jgi:hypothetical protein
VEWLRKWLGRGVLLAAIALAAVLGARAGLYGSSHVQVEPISGPSVPAGPVYFLPRTIIGLETTYRISKCEVTRAADDKDVVSLDAEITARLIETVEPDFSRGYVIRSDSIAGPSWRTDVTVETQSGVLKAINMISTAEPALPQDFQPNSLLARLTQPLTGQQGSAANAVTAEARRKAICGERLVAFLNTEEGRRKPEDHPASMKRFFRFDPAGECPQDTTAVQQSGAVVCAIPAAKTVGALLADTGAVSDLLGPFTLQVRFISAARALAAKAACADAAKAACADAAKPACPDAAKPAGTDATKTAGTDATKTAGTDATKLVACGGVVYRTAGSALVTVCLGSCGSGRVLAEKSVPVSQFGVEGTIPIERRLFSDQTVQLDFDTAGDLIKVRFFDASGDATKSASARNPPAPTTTTPTPTPTPTQPNPTQPTPTGKPGDPPRHPK